MEPKPEAQWNYNPDGSVVGAGSDDDASQKEHSDKSTGKEIVKWSASEYLSHNRGASWYLGLTVGSIVIAGALYFITKSIFSASLAPVLAIIVGVFAARQPQSINYELSPGGITIGSKFFSFNEFKSFSVIEEGSNASIMLSPAKRFMPPISAYFTDADGDKITKMLGDYLPYESKQLDITERLARRLHF